VRLFVERATSAQSDFAYSVTDVPTIAAICERLDGLPLAIELAAARVRSRPPVVLLHQLRRRLALLTGGARDQPARLRAMRDAIAWSYDLLDPTEQALFRRLAVFVGGFTLEATEAVAAIAGFPPSNIVDGVTSLVERSLVQPPTTPAGGPDAGTPRYAMLETIREFALEQLALSGEETEIRRRHAAVYLAFAEAANAEVWGPGFTTALDRLETERDNLRAALGWAVETRDIQLGLRLGQALTFLWRVRGPVGEGCDWLERILDLGAEPTDPGRIMVLLLSGDLRFVHGDHAGAAERLDAALAIARETADPVILEYALLYRGLTALACNQDDWARELWEEALPLFRTHGPATRVAMILDNLGTVARRQGDLDRAQALYEEARALGRDLRVALLELSSLAHLADVASDRGDVGRAATLYRDSLRLTWEGKHQRHFAGTLAGFAGLLAASGQPQRAARLCGATAGLIAALGATLTLAGQMSFERAVAGTRAALEDAVFESAWSEGQAMTALDVLAEVDAALPWLAERQEQPSQDQTRTLFGLTSREMEVLRLLVEGRSDREIAAALFVSPKTVGTHIRHILDKLGVPSRAAAVAYVHRHGVA
jgi:non-specific serine/threonine protein kinase